MKIKLTIEIEYDDDSGENLMNVSFACTEGGLTRHNIAAVRAALNACLDRMLSKLPDAPGEVKPASN